MTNGLVCVQVVWQLAGTSGMQVLPYWRAPLASMSDLDPRNSHRFGVALSLLGTEQELKVAFSTLESDVVLSFARLARWEKQAAANDVVFPPQVRAIGVTVLPEGLFSKVLQVCIYPD